ncbi:Coenzyme F420 hydrogenase/dehydrogenase, beta subunit C-terminal domain [uncultured Coprobacter sp.]|uniref:Coenzyme F420 hydrogenase/dehydrogenase, beta subunit C-terminal domain n=1 Tax=uncultured Coprobacter sp. TaxID=1720550 RepID=UPI00261AB7A2|nr:Coenzyme F420 hydrogenase/dehydrogenase, beta subunit C-terminal domain [uncultured Coprobacter sp.]
MNGYNTFIGYSTDYNIRFTATSGGICSAIIVYLLDKGIAKSGLSFVYNNSELKYEPKLIYKSDDYNISASIYHEIPLFSWIKNHVAEIQSSFVFTALPCQVKPIKTFLEKHNIKSYAIQLVCSSQQSYEATEYLLKRLNISKKDVDKIRYRGEGWPSGIAVYKKNGEIVKVSNTGSIWTDIFHSKLFCMPRCFHCNPDMPVYADIMCADPWRIDKVETEKQGRTLCRVNDGFFRSVFVNMREEKMIVLQECEESLFYYSQEGVIRQKRKNLKHKKIVRMQKNIYASSLYRTIVLSSAVTFNIHLFLKKVFEKIFAR